MSSQSFKYDIFSLVFVYQQPIGFYMTVSPSNIVSCQFMIAMDWVKRFA